MGTNFSSHTQNSCSLGFEPSQNSIGATINVVKGLSLFVFIFITSAGFALNIEHSADPPDTLKFEPVKVANDSIEYELIIIDPAFDSWFFKNRKPIDFYTELYLESWNRQLVPQWNSAINSSGNRHCMPGTYLDYRPEIDYGKELNYKLFYYFMYIQQGCRIFSHIPRAW